mmetsp:Transcript_42545/g.69147  ORF Transcript_42545/g.69147 Transcript_42545/m.69147 type:complete len:80 (+) Transcript_42545:161-400(+)
MLACHDGMAKLLFYEERSIGIEIQIISDQLLILQKLIVHVIRSWQSWHSLVKTLIAREERGISSKVEQKLGIVECADSS